MSISFIAPIAIKSEKESSVVEIPLINSEGINKIAPTQGTSAFDSLLEDLGASSPQKPLKETIPEYYRKVQKALSIHEFREFTSLFEETRAFESEKVEEYAIKCFEVFFGRIPNILDATAEAQMSGGRRTLIMNGSERITLFLKSSIIIELEGRKEYKGMIKRLMEDYEGVIKGRCTNTQQKTMFRRSFTPTKVNKGREIPHSVIEGLEGGGLDQSTNNNNNQTYATNMTTLNPTSTVRVINRLPKVNKSTVRQFEQGMPNLPAKHNKQKGKGKVSNLQPTGNNSNVNTYGKPNKYDKIAKKQNKTNEIELSKHYSSEYANSCLLDDMKKKKYKNQQQKIPNKKSNFNSLQPKPTIINNSTRRDNKIITKPTNSAFFTSSEEMGNLALGSSLYKKSTKIMNFQRPKVQYKRNKPEDLPEWLNSVKAPEEEYNNNNNNNNNNSNKTSDIHYKHQTIHRKCNNTLLIFDKERLNEEVRAKRMKMEEDNIKNINSELDENNTQSIDNESTSTKIPRTIYTMKTYKNTLQKTPRLISNTHPNDEEEKPPIRYLLADIEDLENEEMKQKEEQFKRNMTNNTGEGDHLEIELEEGAEDYNWLKDNIKNILPSATVACPNNNLNLFSEEYRTTDVKNIFCTICYQSIINNPYPIYIYIYI